MDKQAIGKFIAEQRKAKQLTQKQLADKLNVTDKAVGYLGNMYEARYILRQGNKCTEICDGFYFSFQDGSNG